MRGKLVFLVLRRAGVGITPAHAGKTIGDRRHDRQPRDHPRACGENESRREIKKATEGSPPRMRGKLFCKPSNISALGITPAHAGKTAQKVALRHDRRDHPRACGENTAIRLHEIYNKGSPPRMRGKLSEIVDTTDSPGITPAHAGKTLRFSGLCLDTGDHPRACGENTPFGCSTKAFLGSPPRMRGKRSNFRKNGANTGITPAHAGKTEPLRDPHDGKGDHPRACGENMLSMSEPILLAGSPPRMRGKQDTRKAMQMFGGITPAHAGKTLGKYQ